MVSSFQHFKAVNIVVDYILNIVFFYLLIAQVWGNLISYFVLRDSNNHSDNTGMMIDNSSESQCGAQFSETEQKVTNGTIVITPSTVKEIISVLNFLK